MYGKVIGKAAQLTPLLSLQLSDEAAEDRLLVWIAAICMQIVNMSSGLASQSNLAANLRGEGLYQVAAKMGLAYKCSKAALCMREPLFRSRCAQLARTNVCIAQFQLDSQVRTGIASTPFTGVWHKRRLLNYPWVDTQLACKILLTVK